MIRQHVPLRGSASVIPALPRPDPSKRKRINTNIEAPTTPTASASPQNSPIPNADIQSIYTIIFKQPPAKHLSQIRIPNYLPHLPFALTATADTNPLIFSSLTDYYCHSALSLHFRSSPVEGCSRWSSGSHRHPLPSPPPTRFLCLYRGCSPPQDAPWESWPFRSCLPPTPH